MDVLYSFVQNSSLEGMPRWYQIASLFLLAIVLFLISFSLYSLLAYGLYHPIQFGY
ncbi:hypothetical protein N9954_09510 [Maribacter sp.]|nr:hypothetical protein [Maribacter sp.]